MKYTLPRLPYAYDALEPYIDAKTMEIHHTKHHQAYIDKLNTALDKYPALAEQPLDGLLKNLDSLKVDEADRTAIRNHGGGHVNHTLFWTLMDPKNKKDDKLIADINTTFGSVEEFKKQFTDVAAKVFGSGWAWLARDEQDKLHMHGLPNQDSPYLHGHTPIIGLDVWEHAYYLKYQNKRPDYITAWWNVLKLI
ncbi:MAG: superoxide dismutase [Candidatus Doudnabacteria bacterium RIFCSPLOWO2_01_FULL_44_21]|uniref:Superoxide dismutase n=1 Tax=Candidatus Doudnabacteria bacterium RIFCSPLOWO2_01_FULL_44_21 TaxID=1817841 RepID=A0A1F5Q247_9BACT|nr:MAG: superoxide dismutase [Candidatus Doudnabacteria bacterium RIFCSPHIGHO2_02_FULL_43_13b]OGE96194.1 MAG: superoxide dismutase [Candidatus Doudnabacteria bacterium RIFCSPLOWO2_01_FULL_44_21]